MNHDPKQQAGLTLVEIIVAIAVFSVIMLALSGTIVEGLRVRRNTSAESEALAVAASALELHKNAWADYENYKCFSSTSAKRSLPVCSNASYQPMISIPSAFKQNALSYTCLNSAGVEYPATQCNNSNDTFVPEIRRVTVTIRDQQDNVRAQLFTEIGNPVP
jgi:prepilin-type N-terminal cleavage/methylation domain-containing protein